MARFLTAVLAAAAGFASAARAGGPPPVYVVVDKVELEPSADTPDRIKIVGSFIRLENVQKYEYGKPVAGFVYLNLAAGKEADSRTEWAKWKKAAGTGKAVAVGTCGEAGAMLTVTIRKPDERPARPDATYTPGHLGELDAGRGPGTAAPVRDLLAFVKARQEAAKSTDSKQRQ